MKIALCQINPTVGNFDSNKKKVLNYYSNALRLNADIVVFPELTITGYPPQDLLLENGFVDDNLVTLKEVATQTTIPMIIGFLRKENGRLYNSAALCQTVRLQKLMIKYYYQPMMYLMKIDTFIMENIPVFGKL